MCIRDRGYTWHRIIRDIFPPFRNARMAIVCHERPERIPVNVERLSFDYSLPVREPVSSFPMNTAENRRRVIAVKTNLLFVAALTANLGFEAELWPHWSIDLPVWYSPYDITSTRKDVYKRQAYSCIAERRIYIRRTSRSRGKIKDDAELL